MSETIKGQAEILRKMGIEELNAMQKETMQAVGSTSDVVLLSPTGTGKTLAFLLPIVKELDPNCAEIQVMILVPSRELAIQIEQVTREMGTGFKANAIYGGRAGSQDKIDLKHPPAILIGTPGRVADHVRRGNFSCDNIKTLVLDEFDKSLEIGFEAEMVEIINSLPKSYKRVLTSATQKVTIPSFVGINNPININYLHQEVSLLEIKKVISPDNNKLETLVELLSQLGGQPGIIFCNFKDSIQEVSDFLLRCNIAHGCFHGSMEQKDRELSLIKFRNGTHKIIVATDLAARGIDVPALKYIVHYELPQRNHEFTHRNGRTARMNSEGTAYVLKWEQEQLPEFIDSSLQVEELHDAPLPPETEWETLHITGGRRDKISKGDIAGLFFKVGQLKKDQLGVIELKPESSFVGVKASVASQVIKLVNNSRLKKKKVRISTI